MKRALTIALALALAGCARPITWVKADYNPADFERDVAICRAEGSRAKLSGYNDGSWATIFARNNLVESVAEGCMYGRGYAKR